MKKILNNLDTITTMIMFTLGIVMLLTNTWAFGLVGAFCCIYKLIILITKEPKSKHKKSNQ